MNQSSTSFVNSDPQHLRMNERSTPLVNSDPQHQAMIKRFATLVNTFLQSFLISQRIVILLHRHNYFEGKETTRDSLLLTFRKNLWMVIIFPLGSPHFHSYDSKEVRKVERGPPDLSLWIHWKQPSARGREIPTSGGWYDENNLDENTIQFGRIRDKNINFVLCQFQSYVLYLQKECLQFLFWNWHRTKFLFCP